MAVGVNEPGDHDDALDELIHRADLDGLVRLVDARCASADWAGVLRLRDRARNAVQTGRQLWPVATLAEYRLALWAPAEWAATVLDDESGRFTIGPLTEVAAQHHSFSELAGVVPSGPRLGFVAHERGLRGEAIDDDTTNPLEIPFARQHWEPEYLLATYSDDGVDAPSPERPEHSLIERHTDDGKGVRAEDPSVELAVRQLFDAWTAVSDGRVEVVCVEGTAAAAVRSLGVEHPGLAPISSANALAWLAWAGASGGAHGRRRGGAIGRFGAWWLLAALGDVLDEWPVQPGELGALAADLRWYWWAAGEPALGWEVQLAVEDPSEGYAWAISAHDAA